MDNKYRKKPVIIEAIQLKRDNAFKCLEFAAKSGCLETTQTLDEGIIIPTLEGNHLARYSDYIIKGVNEEFYPCKPDIFEKTYEKI